MVSKLSEVWSWLLISDPDIFPHPGSRGQKGTGSRIPIRKTALFKFFCAATRTPWRERLTCRLTWWAGTRGRNRAPWHPGGSSGGHTGIFRLHGWDLIKWSDSQCRSRNYPGFEPSILRHSGIWGAVDEAQCWISFMKKTKSKKSPFKYFVFVSLLWNL